MFKVVSSINNFLGEFHRLCKEKYDLVAIYSEQPEDYKISLERYTSFEQRKKDNPDSTEHRFPFIAYNRTPYKPLDEKPMRSLVQSRSADSINDSSMLKFKTCLISFEFNITVYFSDINQMQEYEVLYDLKEFLSNITTITCSTKLAGDINFYLEWAPLDKVTQNLDQTKYFTLGFKAIVRTVAMAVDLQDSDFIREFVFDVTNSADSELLIAWDFSARKSVPVIEVFDYDAITGNRYTPRIPIEKIKAHIEYIDKELEFDCDVVNLDDNRFKVVPPPQYQTPDCVGKYVLQIHIWDQNGRDFYYEKKYEPPLPPARRVLTINQLVPKTIVDNKFILNSHLDGAIVGGRNPEYLIVHIDDRVLPVSNYALFLNKDYTYTLQIKIDDVSGPIAYPSVVTVDYLVTIS